MFAVSAKVMFRDVESSEAEQSGGGELFFFP